jgi:hypothetical protein
MASVSPQWADILDPRFRKIYGDELQAIATVGPSIFHMETSSRNQEKDSQASGLSTLIERSEGQAISYEDEVQGYDVTYSHREFALGTSVSNKLAEDDLFRVILQKTSPPGPRQDAPPGTAHGRRFQLRLYSWRRRPFGLHFRRRFGPVLQRPHQRWRRFNPKQHHTSDLKESAIENAIIAIQQQLDHKNQLFDASADTLIVPPQLEKEARILLNTQGRVGTANNDINPYQGALKLVVWKWLGAVNPAVQTPLGSCSTVRCML